MSLTFELTSPKLDLGTDTVGQLTGTLSNLTGKPITATVSTTPAGAGILSWSFTFSGTAGVTGLPAGAQTGNITATITIPAGEYALISGSVTLPAAPTIDPRAYSIGFSYRTGLTGPYSTRSLTFVQNDRAKLYINRLGNPNPHEISRRYFEGDWTEMRGQKVLDTIQNQDFDLIRTLEALVNASSGGANVADVSTMLGVPLADLDLGTFTGITIPDDASVKAALQALETKVETLGGPATVVTINPWATTTAYVVGSVVRHTYGGVTFWVRCITAHTSSTFDANSLNWEFVAQQGDISYGGLTAGARIYTNMTVVDPDGLRWRANSSFLKSATDIANEGTTCVSEGATYAVVTSLAHALVVADKGKPVQYTAGTIALGRADASFNSCLGTLVRPIGTTQAVILALGTQAVPAGLIPVGAANGDAFWVDPATPGNYTLTRPSTVGQFAVNVGTYFTGPSRLVVQPVSQTA